jgi:hypothetical protein
MTEQLTANEKAYDLGYNDYIQGNLKIDYSDWCTEGREGSHSAYKAGYEDAENDVPDSHLETE